ncbi:FBOX protein [Geosmithia morbida]|uniref:FBOX protein n=1 Tax=Geosmithia morbida TaxID=1094350 RepID=A0A9P4YY15_9HYPO|nr:FBOX protein [Geosmithia morbida]KAF4125183.1 FBOX protein [Geosmithia morbida]
MAVQSSLIEIDLHRLDVVSRESFEWSITTLSSIHPDRPLAVGTSLGVHLHDFRTRIRGFRDAPERVDSGDWEDTDVFKAIFDPNPLPPYASLSQPTPTSILYLPVRDDDVQVSDDIYVSGRFSNILHYDRRKFPAIVNSIHSGATVNSLAALPYPFYPANHPARRSAGLGADVLAEMKAQGGSTLMAGGGYNQKGSLELYGVGPRPVVGSLDRTADLCTRNRFTAAPAPIMYVTNHGTKIVISDGSGHIKWFERDGLTECRRIRVGHSKLDDGAGNLVKKPGAHLDDVARKVVSTRTHKHGRARPNNDNVLFWTGERLGLVSFTSAPLFEEENFVAGREGDMPAEEEARREYSEQMHEALMRQANEARFLSGLGMGTRSSFGL